MNTPENLFQELTNEEKENFSTLIQNIAISRKNGDKNNHSKYTNQLVKLVQDERYKLLFDQIVLAHTK